MKVIFHKSPEPHFSLTVLGEKKPLRINIQTKPRVDVGRRTDLLARALGWKKDRLFRVVDATAGLGRDLAHMLQLKCDVVGIERNSLLVQALQAVYGESSDLKHSATIVEADAVKLLQDVHRLSKYFRGYAPDVVFLDPMFPEKKKSAAVGKESLLLQALAEPPTEHENSDLLRAAMASGAKRIVVKRPSGAPTLSDGYTLSHQLKGKAVRYDVYINPIQQSLDAEE